ncbi:MAG: hypothetical protein A2Y17_05895 [Clostridiales bacterium GWF2_38_85]|nr:MAG: hypothetical protein A2Y17_05895 [Clostridiales bacterium GWF2_38_85]HBL84564.1 hypothetical protein [Clostridiales bacterium]
MKEIYKMLVIAIAATAAIIGIYTLICMTAFPDFYQTGKQMDIKFAAGNIRSVAATLIEDSSDDILFSICAHASFAITPLSGNN